MQITAFKKKLYKLKPKEPPEKVETFRTTRTTRIELADPTRLEREVRQLLANKISGNMAGLWLLIPEHLRLGTWELLRKWSGKPTENLQPRIALQLVHEAALCVTGIRHARHFSQRGFELANGLPFIASDQGVHELLDAHTVAEAEALQLRLGIMRRACGHFKGELVAIDPFRKRSYTKRQTTRYRRDGTTKPFKTANSFFAFDSDTLQPICFIHNTTSLPLFRSCHKLLTLTADILNSKPSETLVMADTEHYLAELLDYVDDETPFDFLVPLPNRKSFQEIFVKIPPESFKTQWAGYATTKIPYQMKTQRTGPHYLCATLRGEAG